MDWGQKIYHFVEKCQPILNKESWKFALNNVVNLLFISSKP